MTRRTLLIIGAGYEQVRAYEQAKGMGLTVVGTDMNPEAPAFALADHRLICSTRDVDETVAKVSDFAKTHTIHGVMTVANDVPLTVARVAERLGLPGILPAGALLAANKILMKKAFKQAGVPTPAFAVFDREKDFLQKIKDISHPMILKPSDGRGSRGVLYLDGTYDPKKAWAIALENSENKTLLLEEYAQGPQLSVEGLMLEGSYHAVGFGDRNYDNLPDTTPFIVEDGGVIPSRFEGDILLEIEQLIERAALSLGIEWGPAKGDIVISSNGLQIIELAARLSGNYLATHHIPMAYGVDIVGAMIRLALGDSIDPNSLRPKHKKYLGVRYFFPPVGTIKEISGIEEVKSLDYLVYLDIYRKVREVQESIENHTTRGGTIICEADTYDLAKQRVEEATRKIVFKV